MKKSKTTSKRRTSARPSSIPIKSAKKKKGRSVVPVERPIESHDKEVWIKQETVRTMIAACIELVEARGVKKTSRKIRAPEDREVIGFFYGKKYLRENRRHVADRYMIEHAYMVQAATRQRRKVSWKRWRQTKMKSFFALNYGDEYLGRFHLHPTIGSDKPSRTDKIGMGFRKLYFIVYVNGKNLLSRMLNEPSDIKIISPAGSYEVALVRCRSKLKSDGGGEDNYLIEFGIRGWYRYAVKSEPYYTPVKIRIA